MPTTDTDVHVHSGPDAGARLKELVSGLRSVMVTTPDEAGGLSSRPLTLQRADDDGTIWFLVDADAQWITASMGPVNVAAATSDTWLSISGTAQVVRDDAVLDDLGNPVNDAWFPEGTTKAALRIDVDRADYWSGPGRLGQLFQIGKGMVTGERPDLGERGRLDEPT